MTAARTLDDLDLADKRVLIRVDINVPVEGGRVTDATRIERIAPTLPCRLRRLLAPIERMHELTHNFARHPCGE